MASLANLPADFNAVPITRPLGAPYEMWIDEQAAMLRTVIRGVWSMDQTEDYLIELGEMLDECRRRFGRARMMVDRRGRPDQADDVMERLCIASDTLFGERDRVALIVDSSLVKARIRRIMRHAGSQAFVSDTAAELWLTAWS